MTVHRLVCLLLVVVQVPAAYTYGNASDLCVATFTDFEKAAISDNPDNVEALVRAIYQVNRPSPLSVRVVFHGNSSNGTDIISTDSSCPPGKEMWLWVPSPVLMFMEPTKLNLWALYTLNYFSDWSPRHADIYVPRICNSTQDQFNFFNEFTMRVQTYAASSIYGETGFLGNVLKGCGDDITTTLLTTTLSNNEPGVQQLSGAMMQAYFVGNFLLIVLVSMVCMLVLQMSAGPITAFINRHSDTDAQPLYGVYGLFWGCAVMSAVGNILLSVHTIWITAVYLVSGDPGLGSMGMMVLFQVVLGTVIVSLLAIYFGLKLKFSIPIIVLIPYFVCIFCCEKNRALQITKKMMRCFTLWSLLSFTVHLVCRMSFVLLALLARPSTVTSTLAIYLFAAFSCMHLVAMMFTATKKKRRSETEKRSTFYGRNTFQAVALFVMFASLFGVTLFFGMLITAANTLAFYGSARNSINAVVSTVFTPVALAGFTWALYKLGSTWLRTLRPSPSTSEANEQSQLFEQPQMEEGIVVTVPGGQGRQQTGLQYTLIE